MNKLWRPKFFAQPQLLSLDVFTFSLCNPRGNGVHWKSSVQTIYSNLSSFISYCISNNASSFRNNLDEEQQTRRWLSIKQSSIFCLSVCQLTCVDYIEMTFLVELYFERKKKKTFHQTTKCVSKYEICKVIG